MPPPENGASHTRHTRRLSGASKFKRHGMRIAFLFLVKTEEFAGADFQGAGEQEDVVEADILFSAFNGPDEIPVGFNHLAEFLLGKTAFRA